MLRPERLVGLMKCKDMSILNRREFSGLCVAFGSFTAASALDLAASTASTTAGRTVQFRTGTIVPALGQGSANLGKGRRPQVAARDAGGGLFSAWRPRRQVAA